MAGSDALLGEWRFDEAAGDVALDGGVHGLDGRLGRADGADGADPTRIVGANGGALRFDGDDEVRLPDSPELAAGTLSVEAVVRASHTPGGWRYVVSRGGTGCFAGAYGLYTAEAGGIAFYVFDGSRYVLSATARPGDVWDGNWHHVAGTFDGSRLRIYVDGRAVGAPSAPVLGIDYAGTSASTAFGRYLGSCDLAFAGDLDLIRLRAGALSADAVALAGWQELNPGTPAPPGLDRLPPLPAAAVPATLDAAAPAGRPRTAEGTPARACRLALSRTRIFARRRTPISVRVTVRGRPARAVRITARQRGRGKPITTSRTGADGHAKLHIRARRAGKVKIRAAVKPTCSTRVIRVARQR